MWKTDYLRIHERQYKTLKAEGASGWSQKSSIHEMFMWVNRAVQRDAAWVPRTVLELGCGAGNLGLALAQAGFIVSGIDISPTAIAWARENAQRHSIPIEVQEGSVCDLPYGEGMFDMVVDSHCFHCILGHDRQRFVTEAFRALKSGGCFIVMTMCNDPMTLPPPQFFDPDTRSSVVNGIAGRYYGLPDTIIEEITSAGFRIRHQEIDWADEEDPQDELIVEATKN